METVTLHMAFGGYKTSVAFECDDAEDVQIKTQQAIAFYESKGFERPAAPTPTAPHPQGFSPVNPQPLGYTQAQPQAFPTGFPSWQCPVHGNERIKAGYGGRGFECDVKADGVAPQWEWRPGKDKQTNAWLPYTWMGKNGPVFACKWKSN